MSNYNEIQHDLDFINYTDIDINKERKFWQIYIIKVLIIVPMVCPLCNYSSISLSNYDSLFNPIIARCNSSKCRKNLYLRKNTFLQHFPKTPTSVIMQILYYWIIEERNASEINNILKEKLKNYSINIKTISEILNTARYYIAFYYKNVYIIEDISDENKAERFSVDESLFLSVSNEQTWVIGIIDNEKKDFRLEITNIRNEEILKQIITTHIKPGNVVVTDGWSGYNFLS